MTLSLFGDGGGGNVVAGRDAVKHMDAVGDIALLHVDDSLVVIDKPSGLPAVPGRPLELRDCAATRLASRVDDALVVHRLDMATSGLMLFARGIAMQRALCDAFAQRRVAKRYVAVVHGLVADDEGRIDAPLAADWPRRPMQKVDRERGREALTLWRVGSRDVRAGTTRIELHPLTGRTHQLRVHLASIGHPIVGDGLYGPRPAAARRLLLHATALSFVHPGHGGDCQFLAPAPF